MANPTTNYSWPMPTTTDLVTDLPADFAAFGQPVDTSLKALNPETTLGDISYRSSTANTKTRLAIGSTGQVLTVAAGVPAWGSVASAGLVQIGAKTTFTAASGVNVNSCFSSTYNRYLVLLKVIAASGGVRCYVKLRASGTDASAGYYYTFLDSVYSGAAPTNTGANNVTTGFPTVLPSTGYTTGGAFTFFSPNEATQTLMTQSSMSVDAGGLATQGGGVLLNTTQYDGFSLVFASGTYTGELVVYGYSN